MNIDAFNFIRSLRGLNPQEKSVAAMIASHADYKKCECFASMKTIAAESGLKNRETASRICKKLENVYGIIRPVGAHSGGRTPTIYTFTFDVNRDCGITVDSDSSVTGESQLLDFETEPTVTQDDSNRDSEDASTVTGSRPTVTQNASTVTGESHEGFKVLEGRTKGMEGTLPAVAPVPPLSNSKARPRELTVTNKTQIEMMSAAGKSARTIAVLLELPDDLVQSFLAEKNLTAVVR